MTLGELTEQLVRQLMIHGPNTPVLLLDRDYGWTDVTTVELDTEAAAIIVR